MARYLVEYDTGSKWLMVGDRIEAKTAERAALETAKIEGSGTYRVLSAEPAQASYALFWIPAWGPARRII